MPRSFYAEEDRRGIKSALLKIMVTRTRCREVLEKRTATQFFPGVPESPRLRHKKEEEEEEERKYRQV